MFVNNIPGVELFYDSFRHGIANFDYLVVVTIEIDNALSRRFFLTLSEIVPFTCRDI